MGSRKRELIQRKAAGIKPARLPRYIPPVMLSCFNRMTVEELEASIAEVSKARRMGHRLLSGSPMSPESEKILAVKMAEMPFVEMP